MKNKQFFATFAVGALFGASILLTLRGHDLDLLYLQVAQCRSACEQLEEDKAKLEDQLSHAQSKITRKLQKINPVVQEAPDEFTKLAVQREIKTRLRPLLDKDLKLLEDNPQLFKQMLEERTVQLPSQTITLQIDSVVIGETTTLYVIARKDTDAVKSSVEKTPMP